MKKKNYPNNQIPSMERTTRDIIVENTFTYFNLIFLVLGILLVLVGSVRNMTFLPVILLNTVAGIIQELRAKKILEQMRLLDAPRSTVIRNGEEQTILSEELVVNDVVKLSAGEQICADAVLLTGVLLVNEALLTGESDEVEKKPEDALLSGSFVVSGSALARLTHVGEDSYISGLTKAAKAMHKKEQSEMLRALDRLVKGIGVIILPVGALLFFQGYYTNHLSIRDSVVSMEGAVIGMIPEGLYLLTTAALLVSTIRLAKKKVLLHNMKSIETLARVDVLCVDKTGTITEPDMSVAAIIPTQNADTACTEYGGVYRLLAGYSHSMHTDNVTIKALQKYFPSEELPHAQNVLPFSSVTKYSAASFGKRTFTLGAPESLLGASLPQYQAQLASYTNEGFRVLLFGEEPEFPDRKPLTQSFTPLAFLLFTNAVRDTAAETFRYFREQGVAIKVLSGDNPLTASVAAAKAGIYHADRYVDATRLAPEEFGQALSEYTVFGRVTPEQKKELIAALKKMGHIVAMTGDGVNDILAMKEADCSIAMASGTDAAVHAAQVVLTDSDFAHMPDVVLEGRRVVNNIERTASLYLVKNLFSFLAAVVSILFAAVYPLEPTQLTFLGMFTIGIPSFFLAMEPNHRLIQGRFLTNVLLRAIPGGTVDFLVLIGMMLLGKYQLLPANTVSTVATFTMSVVGICILLRISMPLNRYRGLLVGFCAAGAFLTGAFFRSIFAFVPLNGSAYLLIAGIGIPAAFIYLLSSRFADTFSAHR